MSTARSLAAAAREAALAHLARLDAATDLVVACHVTGSAVLDDYHPGRSDLDLLIEISRQPTESDLEVLNEAHQGLGASVQATYLPQGGLAGTPDEAGTGPWAAEGELHVDDRSWQLHPVTWLELARYGVTVLGDTPPTVADPAAVTEFCRTNLREYWAPLLDQAEALIGGREPTEPAVPEAVIWLAFGPPRLLHTIRTGDVISKTEAGRLAAAEWADLAEPLLELVAARSGTPISVTVAHGQAVLECGRRVLAAL
ncbi:hypothetical protein [Actinoalloteichus hymeniacidonis]|uniref:Nucleotidyltransferase family protein n=1 Tax=Actinoalloteichus hymeniacidonis TaxID=340345 RepID=A0AAC9HML3_9PSEU|nr:hypothetical protein [Actinoalloteichus hymeniacidonis]AOS62112.1 nucleotidyltransferase family protein [Actinoalloteichus hymeniacidonis]MBB5909866.1 streptomycin 3'-adenylyltransferase [Actinoalloteichus hymeniacidonis]